MSDYSITTTFGDKDNLASGNSAKLIKGAEFDTEFVAIVVCPAGTGACCSTNPVAIRRLSATMPRVAYTSQCFTDESRVLNS